jgi:hypothetical protein
MPTPTELADQFLAGVEALRKAIAGMNREQLLARPIPGKWSTLEVVAHIADFEPVLIDRMKRILAYAGEVPLLLVADETLFAQTLGYQDRDLETELALIESSRKQMARIIRGLKPEQLELTGCHTKRGLVTLAQVIQGATNHITHHLPFIADKRKALGV